MKYIIKESQYNNAIDKFITYQFEPHEEKRTKKHPDSIFWVKEGEVITEIEKSKYFWINPQIWRNIKVMFSLKNIETEQVIKYWLEEHHKLGGLIPNYLDNPHTVLLEEHYKLRGLTPSSHRFDFSFKLEEH